MFTPKYDQSDKEKLFKASNGVLLTHGLIHGIPNGTAGRELYTIKDEDYGDLPSLRRLYLEFCDPTEILFANEYFYNYRHWLALCRAALKDYVPLWREELELLLQARALQHMLNMSASADSKHYYQANRFLLDKGWKEKESTTIAAKERIKAKAKELSAEDRSIAEDARLLESFQNQPTKVN